MSQQKLKKISLFSTLLFLPFVLFITNSLAQDETSSGEKRQFLITAYYSPKPDQSFYIRGNYEADLKLNGQGTHGADGTKVYVGMLAAPSTYAFGTRVYIPGLGVGEVHDRGGAIRSGGDYDRIDVWMGEGEEGLSRALNWGSRFVEGEVYSDPSQAQAGLDYSWLKSNLSEATISVLKLNSASETPDETAEISEKKETTTTEGQPEVLPEPIIQGPAVSVQKLVNPEVLQLEQNKTALIPGFGKGAQGDQVKQLQRLLKETGYYQADLTGVYDESTTSAVFKLQKDRAVLSSEAEAGAGYFGTKTHRALLNSVDKKVGILKEYPQEVEAFVPSQEALPALNTLHSPEILPTKKKLDFAQISLNTKVVQPDSENQDNNFSLKLNDKGKKVIKLQERLIEGGYLAKGLNTGYFGAKTKEAVIKFQLEKGIVAKDSDITAGQVGPKTLAALKL